MIVRWLIGFLVGLAVALLIVFFADPNRRMMGVGKNEHFFQNKPTEYWAKGLQDPSPKDHLETQNRLKAGGAEAVPVLIDLLRSPGGSDWAAAEVRWQAAEILGQIGPAATPAVPALTAALKDSDPHVRTVAATALGQIGKEAASAAPQLIEMLKTEDCLL